MPEKNGEAYCGYYTWCSWCTAVHLDPPSRIMETLEPCTCTQHVDRKKL